MRLIVNWEIFLVVYVNSNQKRLKFGPPTNFNLLHVSHVFFCQTSPFFTHLTPKESKKKKKEKLLGGLYERPVFVFIYWTHFGKREMVMLLGQYERPMFLSSWSQALL